LENVIRYFSRVGASSAIAECANGYLNDNLERIGLGKLVREHQVRVIDLDREDFDRVVVDDEEHYVPKCLREYGTRIGIPALSKRSGMIFSNNVKLFIGAVPRRMYQIGEETTWRPRVHVDLHRSVANIYRAVMSYAPFEFFVNGGRAMIEGRGELELPVLVGDNGWELDRYLLEQLDLEQPGYLDRLAGPDPM
jgi:hypothetical protein